MSAKGLIEPYLEPGAMGPPACGDFPRCCGCAYQHIPYGLEAALKERAVREMLPVPYEGLVPARAWEEYRNKMEYTFGDSGPGTALGLGMRVRGRFYEVATARRCLLVDEDFRRTVGAALEFFRRAGAPFYRKTKGTGALRNLVVRKGFYTGEILVNLVVTSGLAPGLAEEFTAYLAALEWTGRLAGVLCTINDSPADAVRCDGLRTLWGRPWFTETLGDLRFEISPFSFFQTNSAGAQALYETVADFARGAGKKIYDLYCGTGAIAQVLARDAAEVTGVELVPEAVAAARRNACANGLGNCRFIAGDVAQALEGDTPDLVVLDPPRDGAGPKALQRVIGLGAKEIVYVSCNPRTLLRDLEQLAAAGYRPLRAKSHDLFPRTPHVETVVLLALEAGRSFERML